MDKKTPGLLSDLGTVASLYRQVLWMMGKRAHYGPDWEERLTQDALQVHQQRPDAERERDAVRTNSTSRF